MPWGNRQPPVTLSERQEASSIIKAYRQVGYRPGELAKILGINFDYISFAQHLHTNGYRDDDYKCPNWAIRKIISFSRGEIFG